MLSTATALIQATEESIFDEEVMGFAQVFCHHAKELDNVGGLRYNSTINKTKGKK